MKIARSLWRDVMLRHTLASGPFPVARDAATTNRPPFQQVLVLARRSRSRF